MSTAFRERDLEVEDGYQDRWGVGEEERVCVALSQAGSTLIVPITGLEARIPEVIEEELEIMIDGGAVGAEATITKEVMHVWDLIDMPEFRGW